MSSLTSAIRFLTILRVPGEPVEPGKAAAWFPLIGAALGAAGAGIYLAAARAFPNSLAALLCVAFWTIAGGGLHEDGLADVADAMRAGRSRETMLAILKDSRIGTFGAIALIFSVLLRWKALEHVYGPSVLAVCIAAQAVPRAAMVGLAWTSRPVGTGLGYALASTLRTPAALAAIALGIAAAFLCGLTAGAMIVAGSVVIVRLARSYFYARIGGVNGDCLGATGQLIEIFILLGIAVCVVCSW
jgi:adenosylcobinamide-GDP ribazoletransferase